MVPSAVRPTAEREVREVVWELVKPSPALVIAVPSRTRTGPPPIASSAPGGSERSPGVMPTACPSGRSETSAVPAEPTPVSTMWPAPIVMPPPEPAATTVPVRGWFGASGPGWSRRTRTS